MHIWSGGAAHDRASACVVIAAAALLATSFGTAYAIPAFFPILIKKLAIPSGHLTALFSATGALYFSLGLVIGPVADRNGARRIAMLGQLVLASGLVLISLARSETTFDIAYLLGVGVGVGVGLCFVPAKGAVQAVCWRSPALAGGLAASGIGVGTLVEPPLVQGMIDHFGWRGALDATSVLAICGMFVALLLPQTAKPSGSCVATASDRPQQLDKFLSAERLALLYTAQLFLSIVAFVPLAHLVLFARAKGFSAGTGVELIGAIGLGSLCGRILLGCIAQRAGSCRSAAVCAIIMAIALTGLSVFSDVWELGCDAMLYGSGYGGVIGLLAPVVAEILGPRGIYRSLGCVATSRAVGILIGPWAAGVMAKRLGSYNLPFLSCALLALIAAFLFERLHRQLPPSVGEQAAAYADRRN